MKQFKEQDLSNLPEELQRILRDIIPGDAVVQQIVVHKIRQEGDQEDGCSAFGCEDCSNCPIDAAMKELDDRVEAHSEICDYLNNLYASKNADYGNAFGDTFKELGIVSAITRITDKTNRLKSLCKPGADQQVNDETRYNDLCNKCRLKLLKQAVKHLESEV